MDEFKNENPYGSNSDVDENENANADTPESENSYPTQPVQPQEETTDFVFVDLPVTDSETPKSANVTEPLENKQETTYASGYTYGQPTGNAYTASRGTNAYTNPYQTFGANTNTRPNPNPNPNNAPYMNGHTYSQYTQNPGTNTYTNDNTNTNTNTYTATVATEEKPKKKKSAAGKKVLAILLAVFIVVASIGVGTAIGRSAVSKPNEVTDSEIGESSSGISSGDGAQVVLDTAKNTNSSNLDAVKKARDSVVGIVVYDSKGSLAGEGSGVVMGTNDAGTLTYIITCAHVVSDDTIKSCGILLEDGTIYEATIIGYDERTDIGVLSITETGLSAATFGDSSTLEVTESVYAIGNPGGSDYYGSVTDGIVSAVDRSLTSTYTMQVIQHTAAISPGNSGGALVNSAGQVIGINSSKIAATDYEGIGFAVPISIAKPVVESLIEHGYVPNRPKLGISYASVTNYQVYSMVVQIKGLPKGSVIIASISDDSSLSGGKVEVGDMIISVNGKDMDTSDVLLDVIDGAKVGDEIILGICRVNSRTYEVTNFDVTVTLVEDKGSSTSQNDTNDSNEGMNPFDDDSSSGYDAYSSWKDFFKQYFGN